MSDDLRIDSRVCIPQTDLEWRAVRASGPGGQNVNKVATKVELRFDLEGTEALPPAVKARLRARAGNKVDAQGRLVITSQATRNQPRNLEDARAKLAALIRAALPAPKKRRPTRPTSGARKRRLEEKRQRAVTKRLRKPVERDR